MCPTEQLTVRIPVPLNRRLNELRDEMPQSGAGRGCGKNDLVAAMLQVVLTELVAEEGSQGLARRVLDYYATPAARVMSDPPDDELAVVEWPGAKRGRPPR